MNKREYENQVQLPQKLRLFKYYEYISDANLVGSERYPEVQPTQTIPNNVISFSERSSIKNPENYYLDHFVDDYKFESVWKNCARYLEKYRRFKGVITTDFSVYRDMPLWARKYNVGRNRAIAYFLQRNGIDIVPVASWAYLSDLSWCLDGLPRQSSIAISANGCMMNFISKNALLGGIDRLQDTLHPTNLIISGGPLPELDKKYNNVHYYKNFSQRLKERINNGR